MLCFFRLITLYQSRDQITCYLIRDIKNNNFFMKTKLPSFLTTDSCHSDSFVFVFIMSSDIEKKLLEYRAKRKREEYVNNIKQRTRDLFVSLIPQKPPVAKVALTQPAVASFTPFRLNYRLRQLKKTQRKKKQKIYYQLMKQRNQKTSTKCPF